jgi:hypothetical protein
VIVVHSLSRALAQFVFQLLSWIGVFVIQLLIGIAVAAVIAPLWSLLFGGGFRYGFAAGLFVVGGFAALAGALGLIGESPTQRTIATIRVQGVPSFMRLPEPTVKGNATGLTLLLTGGVLFALGHFL